MNKLFLDCMMLPFFCEEPQSMLGDVPKIKTVDKKDVMFVCVVSSFRMQKCGRPLMYALVFRIGMVRY